MRLIDADALESKITKEKDAVVSHDTYGTGYNNGLAMAHALAVMSPTIDAVPVVRCKDCIHYYDGACLKIYSDGAASAYAWQDRDAEDFCSYGERRSK